MNTKIQKESVLKKTFILRLINVEHKTWNMYKTSSYICLYIENSKNIMQYILSEKKKLWWKHIRIELNIFTDYQLKMYCFLLRLIFYISY